MSVSEALDLIARSLETGHLANGYVVVGDLKTSCTDFVAGVLHQLFPGAEDLLRAGNHPDVFRLVPQGRSRTIKIERSKEDAGPAMRDGLLEPIALTAYTGGWKVGVIESADRLQNVAANAFLKLLEEPPPKTLFLLLTDQPDGLLPTVVSRTQRIDLPLSAGLLEDDDYAAVAEIFEGGGVLSVWEKFRAAELLAEKLAELKAAAEDEDVPLVRKAFFRTILQCVREWLVTNRVPEPHSFRNLEAVEEAYAQSERYLPDDAVLGLLLDRLVFPKK